MRCPKCGYISFDHNQICPKCNKDISDEQAKLNLPNYKSNPPSLLGMLVGEGDESNMGFELDSDAALRDAGVGLDFEETSSMMDSGRLEFDDDDQDLEISLNDDTGEFELSDDDLNMQTGNEDEELSLDMDEVSFEDSDETGDDLDLDLGEVSLEGGDEENETADSLDGISSDDAIVLEDTSGFTPEDADETMEMDSFSMGDTGAIPEHSKSTVELNVSDLKINETGELEISSIPDEIVSPRRLPEEDDTNIDEIDFDSEEDLEPESSGDKRDAQNTTGSLDLGDLAFDDSPDDNSDIVDSGELLQAGELDFDDNETGELNTSDFETKESKKSVSLDSEETMELGDISIDLENLDLDLDLDDSEDEK